MQLALTLLCSLAVSGGSSDQKDPWPQHGGNPQHTGAAPAPLQPLRKILWTMPVDRAPQYSGTNLLIHYTAPMLTRKGSVILPVKTTATGNWILDCRRATDGAKKWTLASDYVAPSAGWGPICPSAVFQNPTNPVKASVAIAGAGGKLIIRDFADDPYSKTRVVPLVDPAVYRANADEMNAKVFINTPLTVDKAGNIYFGYQVTGENSLGLVSGFAKLTTYGKMIRTSISAATNGLCTGKVQTNCAPAISNDGRTVYFAVNGNRSYLVGLETGNLNAKYARKLVDPNSGSDSNVIDLSTSSPMVAPDGSVFYGVVETPFGSNHLRGWMLRFSKSLEIEGLPGAFGWDNTPAIVPSSAVPSYTGKSPYLLFSKYNHYATTGGDGSNKLAVLDPFVSQTDKVTGIDVMKEVLTVVAPTPDEHVGGFREWCVNSVGIDPWTKCALVNCEDGKAYRWDFRSNRLSETVPLTAGIGEAYTPTIIGPDGRGYVINNATLYVLGSR